MIKEALKKDVVLQPHQKRVEKKLAKNQSLLLFHGMGSGKTLSSINLTEGRTTDVVTPASLRTNYSKEIKNFSTSGKRNIVSYEGAAKGNLTPSADTLVIDEAQNLNSTLAKRTQKLVNASKKYKTRILLTGTPIRNNPYEIAPLVRILNPGATAIPLDPNAFKKKFVKEEEVDPGFLGELFGFKPGIRKTLMNTSLIRNAVRGRVDYQPSLAKNFPEKSEKIIDVEMSPEQQEIYETVVSAADPVLAAKVKSNFPLSKQEAKVLNSFMVDARMVSNTTTPYGISEPTNKMKRALKDFKSRMEGDRTYKGVVYSNYLKGGIEEYAKLLAKEKIPYAVYKGGLQDKDKQNMVDQFNQGKIKNLLISGAGAEGLDLKGTRSIQILEPHWNNARLAQVVGRGARYKSHDHLPPAKRKVEVLRYHSTIPKTWTQRLFNQEADTGSDEYLFNLSKEKDELNNQLLNILKEEGSKK